MSAVSDNCKDLPKLNWQVENRSTESLPKLATKLVVAAKSDSILLSKALTMPKGSVNLESSFIKEVKNLVESKSEVSQEFWEQDIVYRQTLCFLESSTYKVKDPSVQKEYHNLILRLLELRATNVVKANDVKKKTS